MSANEETTFVMIKPDAMQRGNAFKHLAKFEKRGYQLIGLKMVMADKALAEAHYEEHKARPFFPAVTGFIAGGTPVIASVWKGPNVVAAGRQILGATNPLNATTSTIRGESAASGSYNQAHASDSIDSAKREIDLWFKQDEVMDWKRDVQKWIWE